MPNNTTGDVCGGLPPTMPTATAELEAELADMSRHHTTAEIATWLGITHQAVSARQAKASAGRPWLDHLTAAELVAIAGHSVPVGNALGLALATGEAQALVPMPPSRAAQELLSLLGEAMACLAPLAGDLPPAAHPLALDLAHRLDVATATLRHAIHRSRP